MQRRTVATILELADYADVSAENVLHVVCTGEAVSEDVERRVYEAIDAIGAPSYPRNVEVLPAIPPGVGTDELLERLQATAAELEVSLPEGVGSVVYEALRVEVRPVAQHVAELGALFERMLVRLEQVSTSVEDERRDRLQDVALLTELVTLGLALGRPPPRPARADHRPHQGRPERPPRGAPLSPRRHRRHGPERVESHLPLE